MTPQPFRLGLLIGNFDCRACHLAGTLAGLCLAVSLGVSNVARAADAEQWGVWETSLDGPRDGNPYLEVQLSVAFSLDGRRIAVPGFYDGEGAYRVRFSPPVQGPWRYETRSNRPELNGKSGSFTVGPPSADNHGPVQVFKTFYLRYADGSPYHQFGTTCYAWVHQTGELQQQTLKTLAASPFNKIRFCVFPVSYAYNQNEPELFAFHKKTDGKFDFDRPHPAFWHHFEQRILDLQRLGIQADVILWHPYDRWGFADMNDPQDDRYLRYCIARLSAYRHVWWSLANEFDFMTDRTKGHRGNKQMEDWDRFFQILKNEDPHGRLRGIHNGRIWYDHTREWVTHASVQSSDMAGGVGYRTQYQKPVIYDECKYEGDVPQGWGNLDAKTMTQRFWLGTMGGCYVGHGETYKHPEDVLWWCKGGVLHGESPQRIQWLKDFMAQAPPFDELQPLGDGLNRYLLAKSGEYYLLYCTDSRPQSVELAGNRPYQVELVDPWEMTVAPVGTAPPGEYTVRPPKPDVAYRFTPEARGEKRRLEKKPPAEAKTSATGPEEPENLALGAKYVLRPAPDYHLCTDAEDTIQLTDGRSTKDYFWTQKGTVGWRHAKYATITVDLGKVSPIGGVSLTTAANRGGVVWPAIIYLLVSDTGKTYRNVGDLVALDQRAHGALPADYAIRRLKTTELQTRGRFVRFMMIPPVGGNFLFTDELEVFRGPDELLQQDPAGKPVGSEDALFAETRLRLAIRHRFDNDAAAVNQRIREAMPLNETARASLLEQWRQVRASLDPVAVALSGEFRAVLPLSSAHARLFQVQADLWRAMGRPPLVAEAAVTWDPLDAFALPPAAPHRAVEVHAMRGEYRAAAVNLYNAGSEAIEVQLTFEGLPGTPSPSRITVQQVEWTDTIQNVAVGAALLDAPCTGSTWTLRVMPGLVRQAWLTFHTKDMPPGTHEGHVVLTSRATSQPLRVPVRLRVYPMEFPRQTTLLLGGWDYSNGRGGFGLTPDNRAAFIRHIQERFVNAPWATASVLMKFKFAPDDPTKIQLDTAELDDWLARWPDARAYMIFLSAGANLGAGKTTFAGAKAGTAEFDRRVGVWISAWMRHFRSKGVEPGRVALLIHDEPWEPSDLTTFFAWARAIKAVEPKVLIWEDPIYREPAKAPQELWDLSDVICPNRTKWLADQKLEDFYVAQHQSGKTLHSYSCSGPARLLDPYAYYRLQAWHCWRYGGTGSFFWALGDNRRTSSWNEHLASSGPFTPLFLDDTSVVAGKHLEAMRESAEDYETFVMLRQAVAKAKAAGRRDSIVHVAEQLLESAAADVLRATGADQLRWHEAKDRTLADATRVRLLEALSALHHAR